MVLVAGHLTQFLSSPADGPRPTEQVPTSNSLPTAIALAIFVCRLHQTLTDHASSPQSTVGDAYDCDDAQAVHTGLNLLMTDLVSLLLICRPVRRVGCLAGRTAVT